MAMTVRLFFGPRFWDMAQKAHAGLVIAIAVMLAGHAAAAEGWQDRVAALDAAIAKMDRPALEALLDDGFMEAGLTDTLFPKPITRDRYIEALAGLHATFSGLARTSRIVNRGDKGVTLAVTWQGVHAGPYMNLAPTGRAVTWTGLEVWTLGKGGRFQALDQKVDQISLLRLLTDPRPDADPYEPLPARTLAVFPAGTFLESVVGDGDGNLYVTKLFTGDIVKVAPDGGVETAVSLDIGASPQTFSGLMCLAWADEHSFYATIHSPDPAIHGVWHIALDGKARRVAPLPVGSLPNGIGVDENGNIYTADSVLGTIWRVAAGDNKATAWFTGEEVRKRPYIGRYPGANGLQVRDGHVYVASSDRALLSRIPILADGGAGAATIIATGVPGDDFAVAKDGTVYVTTHPFNTVIRVSPDGRKAVVASVDEGVIGPTGALLMQGSDGKQRLAVVTDGGLYAPVEGKALEPSVVILSLP